MTLSVLFETLVNCELLTKRIYCWCFGLPVGLFAYVM